MTLQLIKTVGGQNGSPASCKGCGGSHFIKSGNAWHCGECGSYVPAVLSIVQDVKNVVRVAGVIKNHPQTEIHENLNKLVFLHKKLKGMLKDLEGLVEKD